MDNCMNKSYNCDACIKNGNCLDQGLDGKPSWIEENQTKEFEHILTFAKSIDLNSIAMKEQLRSLWVAYCLHNDILVDTYGYDTNLKDIWLELTGQSSFEEFETFMCTHLV